MNLPPSARGRSKASFRNLQAKGGIARPSSASMERGGAGAAFGACALVGEVHMKTKLRLALLFASAATVAVATVGLVWAAPGAAGYETVLLVSNHPGVAATYDPELVNAWGISHGPGTPLWVSDNGTNKTTLYDRNSGSKVPLTVKITHGGAPTGQVWVP